MIIHHRILHKALFFLVLLPLALTACGVVSGPRGGAVTDTARDGAPSQKVDIASISDAVPRSEPRGKYGNPRTYTVAGKTYRTLSDNEGYQESGIASWYGAKFHGRRTSSGEPYDMHGMTAAHKTLPLPTYAEVTNLQNGRKVTVKINDRGPFHGNRLIDLSYAAASKLGILATGTGLVEIRAITPGTTAWMQEVGQRREQLPRMPKCSEWSLTASMPPATLAHPCASQDAQELPDADTTAPDATPNAIAAPPPIPANAEPRIVKLYLQVGAFRSRDNAERLRARIDEAVPRAPNVQVIEGSLYRVRIGPFAKVDEVDHFAGSLRKLGVRGAQVVID